MYSESTFASHALSAVVHVVHGGNRFGGLRDHLLADIFGIVGTAIEGHAEGVAEVFKERDILQVGYDAERTVDAGAEDLLGAAEVRAVEAVGSHLHVGVDGGQALGTVVDVGVVAGRNTMP